MKTIYFIRHAQAEGQPITANLTKKGKEQANSLVPFFKNKEIDRIYSSPFKRAVDTIGPLAESRGLQIIEDDRLGERVLSSLNLEDWQDKLKKSFEDLNLAFEGGESNNSAMARAASMLKMIIQSDDNHIILVSHGNLTTLMLRYFNECFGFEQLMELSNPDVFEIVVVNEKATLRRIWDEERVGF
ncbi:histidine phosphatase family protein [Cytobacillus dafuensis]|uniref:Histidine phosphatase family protein n=1 Tax=Cytobacillus dafuensis TaxID=1742359 RepID=A0A5B8Z6F8_CYTDA|nr:histidine phosphatase family protein [Cytobacillus dafuensis]